MAACGRAPGDTLTLGATSFDLVQYHFHAPSEHTLSERRYPMEMHMVHRSAAGRLAVVGVLIAEDRHNPAFEPVWNNLPRARGVEKPYEYVMVDVDALLPSSHARTANRAP
ncbi:MAG: carbonic anhydrase family protein [Acidobacteria bacterium]|nr:carbonic anhydrase family protein [Acidobacteriota bacterium]